MKFIHGATQEQWFSFLAKTSLERPSEWLTVDYFESAFFDDGSFYDGQPYARTDKIKRDGLERSLTSSLNGFSAIGLYSHKTERAYTPNFQWGYLDSKFKITKLGNFLFKRNRRTKRLVFQTVYIAFVCQAYITRHKFFFKIWSAGVAAMHAIKYLGYAFNQVEYFIIWLISAAIIAVFILISQITQAVVAE
jgi:hypothetical protein